MYKRQPVDRQVKGGRVKYWRGLRASKTVKWETSPCFPLVLNVDGSPWAPACLWLLDRTRARPRKVPSLNPVAQGPQAYKQSLDEFGLQWDDFSAVNKYLCPTCHYKTRLRGLINSGAIKRSTASSRMQTVVGFYRLLMESEQLSFRPQDAPRVDRAVGLRYHGGKGFKQIKEVTMVDVSIRVPKRDYAWDRRIDDSGKLLSLSWYKQKTLVKALKLLDNHDYELVHYTALLIGVWIQAVLTLHWGDFATPPGQINQWPFKLQYGPGAGIGTRGDMPDVHLSVQKNLYE